MSKLLYRYTSEMKYVHVRNTYTGMVVFFATSNFMEGPKPNQTRLYF